MKFGKYSYTCYWEDFGPKCATVGVGDRYEEHVKWIYVQFNNIDLDMRSLCQLHEGNIMWSSAVIKKTGKERRKEKGSMKQL